MEKENDFRWKKKNTPQKVPFCGPPRCGFDLSAVNDVKEPLFDCKMILCASGGEEVPYIFYFYENASGVSYTEMIPAAERDGRKGDYLGGTNETYYWIIKTMGNCKSGADFHSDWIGKMSEYLNTLPLNNLERGVNPKYMLYRYEIIDRSDD